MKSCKLKLLSILIILVFYTLNFYGENKKESLLSKKLRNITIKNQTINETKTNFEYFLNLAISNRSDLKSIKKQLTSNSYDTLSNTSKDKLKSVINEINIKYNSFHALLAQRNLISNKYLNIINQLTELETAYNKKPNLKNIETYRAELKKTRKLLVQKEKKLSKARIELYEACGIPAENLKQPSIVTINQAQRTYINAQKSYIKSVLGISDDKAGLRSSIGSPMY